MFIWEKLRYIVIFAIGISLICILTGIIFLDTNWAIDKPNTNLASNPIIIENKKNR